MSQRLFIGLVALLAATAAGAVVSPPDGDPLRNKQFRDRALDYDSRFRSVAELPVDLARDLGHELAGLGVDPGNAYFDLRTGRWGTLILSRPLVPGPGVGNELTWSALRRAAPHDAAETRSAVWQAFREYLARHAATLRIDLAELRDPRVTLHGERVAQLHVGRRLDDVPVRGASIRATVNSGNLVLLGLRNWGDQALDTAPGIASAAAERSLREHLGDIRVLTFRDVPRLEIVPMAVVAEAAIEAPGQGLSYRLVWVLSPLFTDSRGTWEALVDAHSGELLALQDTNRYAARRVAGGIFPVSNDGTPPDGVEQPEYPMPFADLTLGGEPIGFTDTGGNTASCATGALATQLSGRYIRMNDNCGAIDESAAVGDLDLGAGPGTDCEIPAGDHSPGDTHASRTGFYELNRLVEQARGQLPGNAWLDQQLTANMNIADTCNAFWDGATVNFYRSGGGCANTGEIAAVFDHEWGHGLDDNDADGQVSSPGESIADIFAEMRLVDACMGRGFIPGSTDCNGGYGDPCSACSGIRNADYEAHQSGVPHDIDWILTPTVDPGGGCVGVPGTSLGPCLQETHCEGTIVAEAAWDLVHRDLAGPPFGFDLNTALEIGTRLAYLGSSNVGSWYQCTPPIGGDGCNADGGYLNFLAIDDDNGDLADGTPHMSAIFAAFDRHQLACPTPAVADSGCAGAPTVTPANLTATPLDKGVRLTWDPVPGATAYRIYRTEGVKACDFGKAIVGETAATEFVETGLRNGFEVLYSVAAIGANDACAGPLSACEAVTPAPGAGLAFGTAPLTWEEEFGDGDAFLDNCELGNLSVEVSNSGSGTLSNVRIVAATIPSHPEVEILTELPAIIAPSLVECGVADAAVRVRGGGLTFDEAIELELTVTSDELDPVTVTRTFALGGVESDFAFHASKRFTFETDLEGWELVQGTFDRTDTGGGADGTAFYVASSALLDEQCDQIRSPLLQLSETSTLTLFNQFTIEPESPVDGWFDRANIGLFEPQAGARTVVSPDGGRLYNAGGPNGACVTAGLPGWGGAGLGWMASTWSADALGAAGHSDDILRLDVAYGTDPLISLAGFWFDEVTLTDVFIQEADAQSDACAEVAFAATGLAVDDLGNDALEVGESAVVAPRWTNVGILAQALTGSGDAFTGPGDSTYTIADAVADYGTVDPAAEAACATTGDCYTLSISPPSVRPVRHWDATFDESMSTGEEKAWTLHVGESFEDAPISNLFYRFIETMLHHGVTSGCSASEYCPGASTTRAQMPVFVLRALEGTGYSPPACQEGMEEFSDVPATSQFCPWIEDLADRGIVIGCGGGAYCPGDPVSRAQMAVFALKTFEGGSYTPPACQPGSEEFDDVPSTHIFCSWIEELARRGVVSGCGSGNYCPGEPVARGQMAVFISKTFGLALYGP